MTVVVAIFCEDGVVVASDSMITNSMGHLHTTETKGKKIYSMPDTHLFAFAGDPALAARFRLVLEHGIMPVKESKSHALDYVTSVTTAIINHFRATMLKEPFYVETSVSFVHGGQHHCSLFQAELQPRFLDSDHYWSVFGSGKQYADPFLAFLTDVFCEKKQPNVSTGKFLATWAVDHAIQTNTGGVNGPIQMSILQKELDGSYSIIDQSEQDIEDQIQAIDAAKCALVDWRKMVGGEGREDPCVPPIPIPTANA